MVTLIKKIIEILTIESDNEKFDKVFNNTEDIFLFYSTLNELYKSNVKSKTITLKNGTKIIVSI